MEHGGHPLAERRLDSVAVMPGLPTVERFEALDAKPAGTYQRLVDGSVVTVDHGRRVVEVRTLIDRVRAHSRFPGAVQCVGKDGL